MEDDKRVVNWGFILSEETTEEKGDIDISNCLRCIKGACGHLTALKGTTISDAARKFLQRGLSRFVVFEPQINIIREQKVFVERVDASSIFSGFFQRDKDFSPIGAMIDRLHFETDMRSKKLVLALSAVLGLKWQHLAQMVIAIGMLDMKDIPLAFYRDVEKNVIRFQEWLNDKVEKGTEHVGTVGHQVSKFHVTEKRLSFDDIMGGDRLPGK